MHNLNVPFVDSQVKSNIENEFVFAPQWKWSC